MKSRITVRDFHPSDIEKLLRYRVETARISFPKLKLDKKHSKKAILRHSQKYPGTIKLACLDSIPMGFIMFQPKKSSIGPYGYINTIFVEKPYRNKGTGILLLKEAEKWFHSKRISRIEATITNSNKPSLDFFNGQRYKKKRTVVEKRI